MGYKFSLFVFLFLSGLFFIDSLQDSSVYSTLLLSLVGFFLWSVGEYFGHYLLHYFGHKGHNNHHDRSISEGKCSTSPLVTGTLIKGGADIALILYFLTYSTIMKAIFSGVLLGWALYDILHYCIHAYRPPFKFLMPLWRNHYLHHYDESKNFGVTSFLWDNILNTYINSRVRK